MLRVSAAVAAIDSATNVSESAPKLLPPDEAARVLEASLDPKGKLTIADASAKSGLPLRDAATGLHALVAKYRGHLSVTESGELLFSFPTGFSRPWIVRGAFERAFERVGHALLGVARFVVRAWIAVVLVGYALVFLAILFGLATSRGDRDRGGGGAFRGVGLILRIVFDAFFWMWHPFSPFSVGYGPSMGWSRELRGARASNEPKVPFYERVDRFFFGPPKPKVDPLEAERRIVSEIRAQKGRVGVADVMRVTGLPRDEADGIMSKLMLDYEGTVDVTDDGAIVYRFPDIRKTVEGDRAGSKQSKPGIELKKVPPLTGNPIGTNLAIIGLNVFNLVMSLYAIGQNLTIHRLTLLLSHVPAYKIPLEGTPIALGIVPLVFSIALLAIPAVRAALRPLKTRRIEAENAKLAARRAALGSLKSGGVSESAMRRAVEDATGKPVDEKLITREVAALGGDVENAPSGEVRYRFPDLEREALALEAEREAAAEEEARVGKVVFSSET
jgi:hypothetical protein